MTIAAKLGSALTAGAALFALVLPGCAFPDYDFALTQSAAGEGGLAVGGESAGGGAGDHGGSGVAGQAVSSAGSGNASTGGSGSETAGTGGTGSGTAGTGSGAAGTGGTTSAPQACADYAFLPSDCGCFDNTGHAYLLCTTSRPWSQAESQCEFYQMTLVKIESPAENDWILTQARAMTVPSPFQSFWIGGSSIGSPATWHWADGAIFWQGGATGTAPKSAYFDWRTDNPQNVTTESCVQMDQDGWHDGDCTTAHPYVCEWQ